MFSKSLYLLAYGNIYSNQGAMTPGAGDETADGMSEAKIGQIIAAMRGVDCAAARRPEPSAGPCQADACPPLR
jgi:hypothetical protein